MNCDCDKINGFRCAKHDGTPSDYWDSPWSTVYEDMVAVKQSVEDAVYRWIMRIVTQEDGDEYDR